jgi:surface antigen
LQTQQRVWKIFQPHTVVSLVVKVSVVTVVGLLAVGVVFATEGTKQAHAACYTGDSSHMVVRGDTLNWIAERYHTSVASLAAYNHIANPNLIYVNQIICVPHIEVSGTTVVSPAVAPTSQSRNVFPYGSCTWWANQRYYQLHGVFVPWTTNAMAWQWTARAMQFGWHVSHQPAPGAIIDLQPWVQGAYGSGHVAVVEQVLPGNRVIASSMNWGKHPNRVTYWQFTPGPGVSFISQ